jgi:hypothetical protein
VLTICPALLTFNVSHNFTNQLCIGMKWNTYHTKEIKEKYVYRYLTIEKLVDFLETNSIYLSRLDKFEDNLENIEPYDINELKVRSETLSKPYDANPEISDNQWDEIIRNNILAL